MNSISQKNRIHSRKKGRKKRNCTEELDRRKPTKDPFIEPTFFLRFPLPLYSLEQRNGVQRIRISFTNFSSSTRIEYQAASWFLLGIPAPADIILTIISSPMHGGQDCSRRHPLPFLVTWMAFSVEHDVFKPTSRNKARRREKTREKAATRMEKREASGARTIL